MSWTVQIYQGGGQSYTLSNNCGSTLIRNSKIIAAEGGFAFDLYFWPKNGYTDGVEVKVENSIIEGKIELTSDNSQSNIDKRHNLTITDSTLSASSSKSNGGKISSVGYVTITRTDLSGNSAAQNGGAFYNEGDGKMLAGSASFDTVTFDGNKAGQSGGAIYNKGGTITLTGTNFTNNTASTSGGAIYNAGTLTLSGTNHFEGNKAGDALNDIYNAQGAVLNIGGSLTLDGGITNFGTVTFEEGTKITPILSAEAIQAGSYELISADGTINNLDMAQLVNGAYDLAWDNGTGKYTVTAKTADEIADSLNVSNSAGDAITALLPVTTTGSTAASAESKLITEALSQAAQAGNGSAAAAIVEAVAPSTAPVVAHVTQSVTSAVNNVASARMALLGRSAGDAFEGGSVWAQAIYNKSEQDETSSTAHVDADTYGITIGADGRVNDRLTVGAGFAYTDTDAQAGTHDIEVDSYSVFAYGEYAVDNWFVNGTFSVMRGNYTEEKTPAGVKLKAKYDTSVISANATAGYHFDNGITPEFGLSYVFTHQQDYNDGVQEVDAEDTNLVTARIGAKYETAVEDGSWTLKPSLRLGASYDLVSDDSTSQVRVIGGGDYRLVAAHQERAALDTGVGLEALFGDWSVALNYTGEFRQDYDAHTGAVKVKYHF